MAHERWRQMVSEGSLPNLGSVSVGSLIAGYRLEEQIGHGGMAVVFRARDEHLGRQVALKLMAPMMAADDAFRQRFLRESRAAAAVDDPHIIPVHEAGDAGGILFIAMRYVPGGDVRSLVRQDGGLSPVRVVAVISPVASALDAAHAVGLVHRDVKPENMLLDVRPGRPDHVYLSDFGLSKETSSAGLTGTGQFLGTPNYISPEQIEGNQIDGRADQYSLACTAFEMLAGEPPFLRDSGTAVIWAHMSAPPPPLTARRADLPQAVDEVFRRALAKAPAERYASCQEFGDGLREALGLRSYNSDTGPIHGVELPRPEGGMRSLQPAQSDPSLMAQSGPSLIAQRGQATQAAHAGATGAPASSGPRHQDGWAGRPAQATSHAFRRPTAAPDGSFTPLAGSAQSWNSGPTVLPVPTKPGRPAAPRRRPRKLVSAVLAAVAILAAAGIYLGIHSWLAPGPSKDPALSGPGHGAAVASIPPGPTAYVLMSKGIVPINLTTGKASKRITVPGELGGLAVTKDDRTAYVTAGRTIVPVDLATGKAGTPIPVGHLISAIVLTMDDKIAYVVNNNGVGTVIPVNLATGQPGKPVKVYHRLKLDDGTTVGDWPISVAVTPDGKTVVAAADESWTVTLINAATGIRETPIHVGTNPNDVAITPDGKTAYTANTGDSTLTPVNLATHAVGTPIPVPGGLWAIALAPDGKTAYVATVRGKIITVSLETHATTTMPGAPYPTLALSANGKIGYVAGQFGSTIRPVHLTADTRSKPIRVGYGPLKIIVVDK